MDITRWHIIRHAPVTHLKGVVYGSTDPKADVSDHRSFKGLAEMLPADAVWMATHLSRTVDTARAIQEAGYTLPDLIEEPRFGEQNFGDWHGRTHADLHAEKGDAYHRFWLAPAHERAPNGESFKDLYDRVSLAFDEHSEAHAGKNVVCVAHGGTVRACLAHALGVELENALSFATDNLSVTRIDRLHPEPGFDGGWRVSGVNIAPI